MKRFALTLVALASATLLLDNSAQAHNIRNVTPNRREIQKAHRVSVEHGKFDIRDIRNGRRQGVARLGRNTRDLGRFYDSRPRLDVDSTCRKGAGFASCERTADCRAGNCSQYGCDQYPAEIVHRRYPYRSGRRRDNIAPRFRVSHLNPMNFLRNRIQDSRYRPFVGTSRYEQQRPPYRSRIRRDRLYGN